MNKKSAWKKLLPCVMALLLALSACAPAAQQPEATETPEETPAAQPETVTVQGVGQGRNGEISVEVQLTDGKITAVTVLSQEETAGISDGALEQIPAAIVEAGSADVDVVAGATLTSNGIIEAVKNALASVSGGEEQPAEQPEQEGTGDWEATLSGMYEQIAEAQEKYAPEVRTLESGVQVQRTPLDSAVYNTRVLHADERGCAACHESLEDTVENSVLFPHVNFYRHVEFDEELGIEMTIRQCYVCHDSGKFGNPTQVGIQPMIHGIHKSAQFEAMGGDCWSCHVLNDKTGEMDLWDYAKYDVLRGITKIADVQGEFRYDQNKRTEKFFAMNWMYKQTDYKRVSREEAGTPHDPVADDIYNTWTITVDGEVENPFTMTLAEMMEEAPVVRKVSTMHCNVNPFGGPWIENVEITGIPISWLLEKAQVKEGKDVFFCGDEENMAYPQRISRLEEHPAFLVYEIDGQPLTYEEGYPVFSWYDATIASAGRKQVTNIRVASGEVDDYNYTLVGTMMPDGEFDNIPNIALCHLVDGQVISAAEPYTFEGYAHGFDRGIAAIEISFDNGATWTRFDTSDSEDDKWVYWYFTWTPEGPGSYTISARAVAKDGSRSPDAFTKLITVQ